MEDNTTPSGGLYGTLSSYSNGKIYIIRTKLSDECYIGSTIQPLKKRYNDHKNDGSNSKILFEKYGYDNCYIELLENYPCENKTELRKREGEYMKMYWDKCVNKNIAGRDIKEYQIEYFEANKDK